MDRTLEIACVNIIVYISSIESLGGTVIIFDMNLVFVSQHCVGTCTEASSARQGIDKTSI